MKEGRKPEYPEKTPDDEFQKINTCRDFRCIRIKSQVVRLY